MTVFLRVLEATDKHYALDEIVGSFRNGIEDSRIFPANTETFKTFPGASFAYWVGDSVRNTFKKHEAFESAATGFLPRRGVNSNDDFRFLRSWCEVKLETGRWMVHPKGGEFRPYYADVYLVVDWLKDGAYLEAERVTTKTYKSAIVPSKGLYFRPGLTWSRRTKSRLSMRVMPRNCIFGDKGPAVIAYNDNEDVLFWALAISLSSAFHKLVEVQLAAADARPGGAAHSFEVGVIQTTPLPAPDDDRRQQLVQLARRAWALKRALDTTEENSHAFHLPAALRVRVGSYDLPSIEAELAEIQVGIDEIAFELYGFSEVDRVAARAPSTSPVGEVSDVGEDADENEDGDGATEIDQTDGLLSWAVGVAFGRFDWRLATGERDAPPEPDPFDPLPAKSPGMLPDGAAPFHAHNGILVDDRGHPDDLARLIEELLARVDTEVPGDVRRWLQRDFFPLHLRQYSKSRRKAPIYWPLSTSSGSYTLWLYYPSLTSQTLYTAVNDFVEPNLKQVARDAAALRDKGAARSRDDEKAFEGLQSLELELIELRDTLLQIAPTYRPNHDDGVQITAAPLWQLFQHKPWQKVLKDTWTKLEKGEYDWAQLAMAYWPDRVREKCKTDKSLAIAHDREQLYEPASLAEDGKRKKKGGVE
ncbi:hypothetical protein [Sinorhizobium arboris]|uniref:hypothetical protein n=1 Tax=Sinorhizobium arboris TaxID=76745 RepID=UPI00041D301A|nr:hypothetical protein [Sinorhizobium arboris]